MPYTGQGLNTLCQLLALHAQLITMKLAYPARFARVGLKAQERPEVTFVSSVACFESV